MSNDPSLQVMRRPVALTDPPDVADGLSLRYGLSLPFQIAERKAAVLTNVRRLGVISIDFENGGDVILFDHLDEVSANNAITLTRNHRQPHPETGQPLIMVAHNKTCGFVPLGAKLADGRPHPHAGTGFALVRVHGFAADFSTRLVSDVRPHIGHMELLQLACDGRSFAVTDMHRLQSDPVLLGSTVIYGGLGGAIPDGEDLLFGLVVRHDDTHVRSGLGRWRRGPMGWRPISFTPVTPPMESYGEPSVIRDTDGGLLVAARGGPETPGDPNSYAIRVWRSIDGANHWEEVITAIGARAHVPVILNQAADGSPYIASSPYDPTARDGMGRSISIWSHRQKILLWPLSADRRRLLDPIPLRDTADFGPAPEGRVWYADHAQGATVQLADGQWHHLVGYRVRESQHTRTDVERATPFSGSYIDEVITRGEPLPRWRF